MQTDVEIGMQSVDIEKNLLRNRKVSRKLSAQVCSPQVACDLVLILRLNQYRDWFLESVNTVNFLERKIKKMQY